MGGSPGDELDWKNSMPSSAGVLGVTGEIGEPDADTWELDEGEDFEVGRGIWTEGFCLRPLAI